MHDRRSSAPRWLAVGALLALAALVALWSRSDDVAAPVAHESVREAAGPPGFDAEPDTAPTPSDDATDPAPLVPHRGVVRVVHDESGYLLTTPDAVLSRPADGWSSERRIGGPDDLTWSDLPPGDYRLAPLHDAWIVDAPAFTLAANETRAIVARSRHRVRVRVVGARTGRIVPIQSVTLRAPGEFVDPLLIVSESIRVLPQADDVLLAGIPKSVGSTPITEVGAHVATALGGWDSAFVPLASLVDDAELLVQVAEPAIVGRVTRDPPATAADPPAYVCLVAADAALEARPDLRENPLLPASWRESRRELQSAQVERDGAFEFLLLFPLEEPVKVCAFDGVRLAAVSEALIVPPSGEPLRVDLHLGPAGRIEGRVTVPLVSQGKRSAIPAMRIWQAAAVQREPASAAGRVHQARYTLGVDNWTAELDLATLPFAIGGLPTGEYDVFLQLGNVFRPEGTRTLGRRIHVTAGRTSEVAFDSGEPAQGVAVRGTLILPSGFDPKKATVVLEPDEPDDGLPSLVARLDGDGAYALQDIRAGDYTLSAEATGTSSIAVHRRRITIAQADIEVPALDLSQPAVRLHVGRRRAPRLALTGEGHVLPLMPAADGTALVFGLPPGHYTVRADGDPLAFELPPGRSDLTVEIP